MHASSGIAPEEADGRSSASAISDVAVPAFRVRVRTMAGEVLTVPCPDGALTTVGNVKRVMSTLRPVAWSRKRLCLMLPQSPTSESHELSPTSQHPTPLADDAIVSACGIKGSTNILFDLFVQDLVWSASERKLHALIANGKRDVSIRGLTDQDVAAVAWALSNEVNPSLRELSLHFFAIGNAGLAALGEALHAGAGGLTQLSLTNNGIYNVDALCDGLRTNSHLEHLCLGWNGIGDAGCAPLGAMLRINSCLQVVRVECNSIGDAGATALGASLHTNQTLQALFLGQNRISCTGISAIAASLRTNSNLRRLYLGHNRIRDAGAIALGRALGDNSSLEELELMNNSIGDAGTASLAEALLSNRNIALKKLKLKCNQIAAAGASALGTALCTNSSLQLLDLGENLIGDAGIAALGDGLRDNATLTWLNIRATGIGAMGRESILELARVSKSLATIHVDDDEADEARSRKRQRNRG